jgi:DNA topoisomerase-1
MMVNNSTEHGKIVLRNTKLMALFNNSAQCAIALHLTYITDKQPGIIRKKIGETFRYLMNGKVIKDQNILLRIKKLVIPPAWQRVWISPLENGHLQATGLDTRNRKQYLYHPSWNDVRNHAKFAHLYEFGNALPALRIRLQKDLRRQGLPMEKVLAAAVSIIQATCIRVGSSFYEQLYGSYGLTTLKDKHVTISGDTIQFSFRGKKRVQHDITLQNRQLANIVKQCRDIKGKYLFQYYSADGKRHHIDSTMVNNYIREISGGCFTAKDFRTWVGTLHAIESFKEMGPATTNAAIKRNVVAMLNKVARHLGNTRTVCKRYYVHPVVVEHYTNNRLHKYLSQITKESECTHLSHGEQVLMSILKK